MRRRCRDPGKPVHLNLNSCFMVVNIIHCPGCVSAWMHASALAVAAEALVRIAAAPRVLPLTAASMSVAQLLRERKNSADEREAGGAALIPRSFLLLLGKITMGILG